MSYFIDSDDNGHWYVIPLEMRDRWEAWLSDEEAYGHPDFAHYINGHPNNVIFQDYYNELET